MADLLLYGSGWTQRWTLDPRQEAGARSEILKAGSDAAGTIAVTDPNTDAAVTMVVNWRLVAVAVILDDHPDSTDRGQGRYA